jgi:hypothetical protein
MNAKREFLEPGWSISRAGCYEIFKIVEFTGTARTTRYDCVCLRCGTRHILERHQLMRLSTALKKTLGKKGIRYWLQVHGTCPNCTDPRPRSPARACDCISYAEFIRHKLDALGFQLLVVTSGGRSVVQICDSRGKVVTVRGTLCAEPNLARDRLRGESSAALSELKEIRSPARMVTTGLNRESSVEAALETFLSWMEKNHFEGVESDGGFVLLQPFYCVSSSEIP